VEVALVWVLFSDAARVPLRYLRTDAGRCLRLLGVGLPLTVLAGWALAAWLLPGAGGWLALLLGASLALTDAALGTSVVTDPAVPARVRRLITVESGLNDGILTPVVFVALAGAASAEGLAQAPGPAEALVELAVGAGGSSRRCARPRRGRRSSPTGDEARPRPPRPGWGRSRTRAPPSAPPSPARRGWRHTYARRCACPSSRPASEWSGPTAAPGW
jgi:hypothetical protein